MVDESKWFGDLQKIVEDAYLSSSDVRAQSGFAGDEARWERARRVITEVMDRDGSFLDVGCANGLLMESIVRWTKERDLTIEPFGFDLSPRLLALAKARLPQWSERFYSGNILDWRSPRRFDYVRVELDYVPSHRRAELIDRLLRHVLTSDGRLIACRYSGSGEQHPTGGLAGNLHELGYEPTGHAHANDLDGSTLTHVAWIDRPVEWSLDHPEELTAGAVTLRRWRAGDATAIAAACSDKETQRWLPLPSPYAESHALEYVAMMEEDAATGRGFALAIVDPSSDRAVGSIGCRMSRERGVADVGYWIAPDARGKGVATTALRALSAWVFANLHPARIELVTDPENVASQRVAEKAGFVREGVLRAYHEHRGLRVDVVMFSLIPTDRPPRTPSE
ncbi:MAG: GNAT family N-acetyltransferase [Actinomycetota bacterium]|nr:GNAT family N-acetyltransferase [Actinomycetota bacterium]